MKLQTKIAVLSIMLAVDLVFFLLFFEGTPWPDDLGKTIAIVSGFVIAIILSSGIAYILLVRVRETVKQG
jgi:hypothetical protein